MDDDLLFQGRRLTIEGTVKGDVFVFAQEVELKGRIEGELFAFAQRVAVLNTILGPARIFAQEATIKGQVRGNLTFMGSDFHLEGCCGRDLSVKSGKASINGFIQRDLGLKADRAVLNGPIGRHAYVRCQKLILGSSAKVSGNLNYQTPAMMEVPPSTVPEDRVRWQPLPQHDGSRWKHWLGRISLLAKIFTFLSSILIGILAIALFRRSCLDIVAAARTRPGRSLGWGVLWLVALPILTVILAITIIGLPLSLFLAMLYIVVLYLSAILFSLLLGQLILSRFLSRDISPYLAFITGAVVLTLGLQIPVLNIMIKIFVLVLMSGAFIASRYLVYQKLRQEDKI